MSRAHVAAISGLVCTILGWLAVSAAAAQAGGSVSLSVRAETKAAERCFDVSIMQQRIAHYGEAKLARARELRLELHIDAVDSAELFVYRGSTLVARRHFGGLPDACADRRDMVALSIALALEGVIRELEPAGAESVAPAGSAAAESDRASESAASSEAAATSEASSAARGSRVASEAAPPPAAVVVANGSQPAAPDDGPRGDDRVEDEDEDEDADEADDDDEADSDDVPRDDSASNLSIRAHLSGRFLVSALPSLTWTGELGTELWVDRTFGFQLSGLASTLETSEFAGGRVDLRLVGGALLGCYAFDLPVAAHGCVGAIFAATFAHGRGYSVAFPDATLLWAAGTAQFAVAWPDAEPVSIRLVIQAHANFVRPVLHVAGSRDALSPFWLGGSGGLDLVVSFD